VSGGRHNQDELDEANLDALQVNVVVPNLEDNADEVGERDIVTAQKTR
jgi:hypothetical protein